MDISVSERPQPLLSLSIVQDLNSEHTGALYPEDDSDFQLESPFSTFCSGKEVPKYRNCNFNNEVLKWYQVISRNNRYLEWNASHSIDTAMVTKVPILSISTSQSLSSTFSNSPLSSSRPSGNRSPYVRSLLHRRRCSRYCRLYSTSHDALSEARHSFLLLGSGTSASPPHCGRPGACSMLKMWMMSTRITAVLLGVETVSEVQAVLGSLEG
jgi:hypothetical protein